MYLYFYLCFNLYFGSHLSLVGNSRGIVDEILWASSLHLQLNYSYNNFTFSKKPSLCYRILWGLVVPQRSSKNTNAKVTKSKGGEWVTVDTMGGDFVSCLPRRREEKVPTNSKKLRRRNWGQMWGESDPALTRLTLLSFVGPFTTSSSFSLL